MHSDILGTLLDVGGVIVCAAITWLAKILIQHINSQTTQQQLYDIFEQATAHVQDTYTEWKKRASADGKLTKEEAEEALKLAWTTAIDIAKDTKVQSTVKALTETQVRAIVQTILAWRNKNVKVVTPVVAPVITAGSSDENKA